MNVAERSFADHQNQLAALFQNDVGGTMNERIAIPMGDGGECARAARRHDHAIAGKRSAGDRGSLVEGTVVKRGELLNLLQGEVGFFGERARTPLADDEVGFGVGLLQKLQQANAINDAACAGDSDNQPGRRALLHVGFLPRLSHGGQATPVDGTPAYASIRRLYWPNDSQSSFDLREEPCHYRLRNPRFLYSSPACSWQSGLMRRATPGRSIPTILQRNLQCGT